MHPSNAPSKDSIPRYPTAVDCPLVQRAPERRSTRPSTRPGQHVRCISRLRGSWAPLLKYAVLASQSALLPLLPLSLLPRSFAGQRTGALQRTAPHRSAPHSPVRCAARPPVPALTYIQSIYLMRPCSTHLVHRTYRQPSKLPRRSPKRGGLGLGLLFLAELASCISAPPQTPSLSMKCEMKSRLVTS